MTKGGARKMITTATLRLTAPNYWGHMETKLVNARVHRSGLFITGNVATKVGPKVSYPTHSVAMVEWGEVHDPKTEEADE